MKTTYYLLGLILGGILVPVVRYVYLYDTPMSEAWTFFTMAAVIVAFGIAVADDAN